MPNGRTIISAAFDDIGVLSVDRPLSAAQGQDGLRRLNTMINSWATFTKTQRFLKREIFSVVAGQRDYTMGPGGDFNTSAPQDLQGAGLLLNGSSPPVEIPRGLLTQDGWEAIQIKDLQNSLWTNVYFQPTYAGGLATVSLWPVPNTALNQCVLYSLDTLQPFADLTTNYDLPYGYEEALEYNLALRLSAPYSVPLSTIPTIVQMAQLSLGAIKRANYTITDLPQDQALTGNLRGGYNILTGQGGV